MASFTSQANVIDKKFQKAVKSAKTKKSLVRAYSTCRKAHARLLKKHLRENMAVVNKAKRRLD